MLLSSILLLPTSNTMREAQESNLQKRIATHKRRSVTESAEFDSTLTVRLDGFFRQFMYFYPGKNKQEIVQKCLTGNAYWITNDSLYFSDKAALQKQKIQQFRKKNTLKNGTFPPTKDGLEQQKFILLMRKLIAQRYLTQNIQQIRSTTIPQALDCLERWLETHQQAISGQIQKLQGQVGVDAEQEQLGRRQLHIAPVLASQMFAYERLEKEVIQNSITKAQLKEIQPMCDFCFLRERDIIKCVSCDLHAHVTCFPRAAKSQTSAFFQCDNCSRQIPEDAQCQLCPVEGGHFLQLQGDTQQQFYTYEKGESCLKFNLKRYDLSERKRQFIHVSCFVLHSECSYNIKIRKVEGFHLIDRTHKQINPCSVCGTSVGLTVGCNNQSCRKAFHPQCAKRQKLSINVIKANNKALLQIYCQKHKKPQSFQYLKDSVVNRIKQLKKFYQNLEYEMKRYGAGHNQNKNKKTLKVQELIKNDKCLYCEEENDFRNRIVNCKKCYGWFHEDCCMGCPQCDC